jgi:hypothetical protein
VSLIKVSVDAGGLLGRQLSELERKQLPFATVRAINETAFQVHERWKQVMPQVFDRPTALTLKGVAYKKASLQQPTAEIFVRDEVFKGTAPAKYLQAEVSGGPRRQKRFERALQAAGLMPAGTFAVPGKGAELDAHGNLTGAQFVRILSQLRASGEQGYSANETADGRGRRHRREAGKGKKASRRSDYFAVPRAIGGLKPGVYQRIRTGFGRGVVPVLIFVRSANYRARYPVFDLAQKTFDRRFPAIFRTELDKAVRNSFARKFA